MAKAGLRPSRHLSGAKWQVKLEEKFYLESVIIDGETFAETAKIQENPFLQNCIVITSYNFAYSKADCIKEIDWDIAILDEAHKMRNVYKKDNVIARSIRTSLRDCFKLLLTATPLQNSLLELFGLTSFIDDYIFGSIESFKIQFSFLHVQHFCCAKAGLRPSAYLCGARRKTKRVFRPCGKNTPYMYTNFTQSSAGIHKVY